MPSYKDLISMPSIDDTKVIQALKNPEFVTEENKIVNSFEPLKFEFYSVLEAFKRSEQKKRTKQANKKAFEIKTEYCEPIKRALLRDEITHAVKTCWSALENAEKNKLIRQDYSKAEARLIPHVISKPTKRFKTIKLFK